MEVIDGDLSIVEAPVATKAGEERLIEWRNTLVRDAGGAIVGTFSSGTDITERSRSIEALRAAEERMRFALESANVGIWDMDYGTGVLQWSPILEAQYGFAPATFGRTFEAFMARVHPADRDALLETMGRAARGGTDFSTHHRTVWPDGTVRWVTGAGRIQLDAAGRPMRGVGISFDVTERHTLEAQFQQAQKMEAIGRLAGGVAHDFNNLLTAILGYCELLLNDLDPADAHVPDILEIQKAGVSATALTRQLLAFSRKEPIQAEVLDLNHIITSMRLLLQRLLGEDVRVVLALAPGPARVSSDRGQLEQVVMNLAVNARDAMPSGGAVTIRTANVQLDAAYVAAHVGVNPGPHVALTISDSGTGMSAEVQSHLFEPFFTTKAPGHGTGLGLPTVAGIVARSGGTVTVASELGVGTAFTILLPAIDAPLVAVAVPAVPAAIAAPAERILVVEDEEGLRALTRRLLERLGYGVEEAACAEDALRLFDAYPPIDVVLSDVVMPGASGPELARQLVARQPNLRVVFMSGYTEETIARHGVTGPDVIFLQKPFTTGQLGRVIRTALDAVRS
jgi:PAS domain S-box-containing protein